jgi:hypothetical protein
VIRLRGIGLHCGRGEEVRGRRGEREGAGGRRRGEVEERKGERNVEAF